MLSVSLYLEQLINMKKTNKTADGTSFYDMTVFATPQELNAILGNPVYDDNTGDDKVNMEWISETNDGAVFTVYDWKEYRSISNDEKIEWHIGGHGVKDTLTAKLEITRALNNILIDTWR